MERSPLDLLVYALIFAGIMLANYLLQRFAKRTQQAPQAEPPPEEVPLPEEEAPPEALWGRTLQAPTALAVPAERTVRTVVAAAPPAPRGAGARALFGSREDIRRGIVLMTVLGPCRAEEPPGRR